MSRNPIHIRLVFAGVVVFLLLLVGWWIFFVVRESYRLDEATRLVTEGRTQEALRELGADAEGDFSDKAKRQRLMFTAEGAFMGLLVLVGVFMLYRAILRENRLRTDQERFLTGATHRLKTPLATVRLGVESMLAGTMPDAKREHYLQAMLREIDRLENDVTNVLAAGGLEASGKGLQRTPGDLAEDVRDAANSMRDRFAAAGVDLHIDLEEDVVVSRDGAAIRLVLHNVLDNAAKYSAPGSSVDLSLTRDAGSAHITIRDRGRGIPADDLPRIFERFFCGQAKGHAGGSGIGLYLAKELVASHGGTIEAHPASTNGAASTNGGTKFSIRLPIHGDAS